MTYFIRNLSTHKLVAMVNAHTYCEALDKAVGEKKWHSLCYHRSSDVYCPITPNGTKKSNYITFKFDGSLYCMYHI